MSLRRNFYECFICVRTTRSKLIMHKRNLECMFSRCVLWHFRCLVIMFFCLVSPCTSAHSSHHFGGICCIHFSLQMEISGSSETSVTTFEITLSAYETSIIFACIICSDIYSLKVQMHWSRGNRIRHSPLHCFLIHFVKCRS